MRSLALFGLIVVGLSIPVLLASTLTSTSSRAGGPQPSPHIVEVEMPNAYCYVLYNRNKVVGDIDMLDCVRK